MKIKNTATKRKLLVVNCLIDTRCSTRYGTVYVVPLGPSEYIDLLKVIPADGGNRNEVQNETKELVARLHQLETCSLLTV